MKNILNNKIIIELIKDYDYEVISINNNTITYKDMQENTIIKESINKFINRFIDSIENKIYIIGNDDVKELNNILYALKNI